MFRYVLFCYICIVIQSKDNKMNNKKINFRVARSEAFTDSEKEQIKQVSDSHKTMSAAAQSFMIDRTVLTNILLKGTAHPDTVKKVRKALVKLKITA